MKNNKTFEQALNTIKICNNCNYLGIYCLQTEYNRIIKDIMSQESITTNRKCDNSTFTYITLKEYEKFV